MKLHSTFLLLLFSLNCFSLNQTSKELTKARKKFDLARSEYSSLPPIDNSTLDYLVTDRIYQVPKWIQPLAPNGFRWNASVKI